MSSALADLDFPTELQRVQVKHRVNQRLMRIALLQQEIAQLVEENSKDNFYIATHRLLPQEILGEIFIHAASSGCGAWLAPFVISHVSRRWRNVVMRTPCAWSYICIKVIPESSYFELVKLWLQLSSRSPLHLRFETPHWGTATRDAVRQTCLGSYLCILRPHVLRWHSVHILMGDTPQYSIWNTQLLLQKFNFPMHNLKSFCLDTMRSLWQDYLILKGQVPLLEDLNIGYCRPSLSNHWLYQLKRLEISRSSHALLYIHGLLQACPLLTYLKLDGLIKDRELRGLNSVTLPHLRELYLNDIIYLSFLKLPSLTTFTYANSRQTELQDGDKLFTHLGIMLDTSENHILTHINITGVEIGRLRPSSRPSSIQSVRLTKCDIRSEALANLGDLALGSRLSTLEIISCDKIPCTFLTFITKKDHYFTFLKKLMLFDCFGITEEMVSCSSKNCTIYYSACTRSTPYTTRSSAHLALNQRLLVPPTEVNDTSSLPLLSLH